MKRGNSGWQSRRAATPIPRQEGELQCINQLSKHIQLLHPTFLFNHNKYVKWPSLSFARLMRAGRATIGKVMQDENSM